MDTRPTDRRICGVDGSIDVWEHPQASFSWTPQAIRSYVLCERWEHLFNALVLMLDPDPRGVA